jgi:hypothetical protein
LFTAELLSVRNYVGLSVGRIAVTRGFSSQLPPLLRLKPPGPVGKLLIRLGLMRQPY